MHMNFLLKLALELKPEVFLNRYTYLNKSITIKSCYKILSVELNERPVCA
jgi:hypothetical protein